MFKNIDATTLNKALINRETSVLEVVEEHKKALRTARTFNAITHCRQSEALEEDAKVVQERIDHGDEGPLLGIPITVKDVIAVANMPLTGGSLLLSKNVATKSAPVVQTMADSGGLVVAKTNCPEFAFGITTSNLLYGTTQSPIDPLLSPGGSSGGEAVAVATGVSLIGVGTDFGGSLRWPSQCLGLASIRPTPQTLPSLGQIPGVGKSPFDGDSQYDVSSLQYKLQVPGFIARSVRDLKRAFAITSGPFGERYQGGTRSTSNSELHQRISEVEIGWSDGTAISLVDKEIIGAIEQIMKELEASGFRTTYHGDAFIGAREAFDELRSYDDLAMIRQLAKGRIDELSSSLQKIISSPARARDDYQKARENGDKVVSSALASFESTPLFILPIAGAAAVGHDDIAMINGSKIQGFNLMAHCRAISMLGFPVVSVPIAKNKIGLPFGIQIVAPPHREDLALELASAVESIAGGWSYFSIE